MADTSLTATIGDRVWNDVNLNGVQDTGEIGLSEFSVKLFNATGTLLGSTLTNSSGLYQFSNLAAGSYKLQFIAPSGYSFTTRDVGVETTDSDADASGYTGIYTVNAGDTLTSVDAGIVRLASLGDKVWTDANRNGTQDAGETGIAGMTVKLHTADGNIIANTTTDANGFYRFSNLAPAQYKVQFIAPSGYSFTTRDVSGASDSIDSDADATGLTGIYTLTAGQANFTVDAGLIANINRAPVANNDTLTTPEDTPLTVATSVLTANDTDADADTLTITALSSPSHGSFSLQNNQLTFTPHANYTGPASVSYTVSDGKGGNATATVNINVTGVNDAPIANNDPVSMSRVNTTLTSNVVTNDQDVDGDTLTVSALRTGIETGTGTNGTVGSALAGSYGTLTLQANGSYSYALDRNHAAVKSLIANQYLNDYFTYTINDGKGSSDSAQLSISISGANGPIVAKNDTVTMTENHAAVSANVLSNDIDPEGDALSVNSIRIGDVMGGGSGGAVGSPFVGAYGTLLLKADGSFNYTLNSGDGKVSSYIAAINRPATGLLQSNGKIVVAGDTNKTEIGLIRYNSDGSLDSSFDGDGKVLTSLGNNAAYKAQASALAQQTDGKIVAAGEILARYNTDGSLDTSFDGDGKVSFLPATGPNSLGNHGYSVAIQHDGKIVVAGESYGKFALWRYNSDGSLDSSFDSDGMVTTALNGNDAAVIADIALLPNGKIMALGSSRSDTALARYNSDGSLDTSFDGDGKLISPFSSYGDYGRSVVVQPDGKILISAINFINGSAGFATLARYNPDGSFDLGFNGTGKLTFGTKPGSIDSITLQDDGKFVVAGSQTNNEQSDFAVARFNSNGTPDTSFGNNGWVTTDFTGNDAANTVMLQSDGKIVVTGSNGNYGYAMARYNSDGSIDTTFDRKLTSGASVDDIFTYTARDSNGAQATASLTVTITSANTNPDAINDTLNITENTASANINVLSNDTDAEHNQLSVANYRAGNGSTATAGSALNGYYGSLNIAANGTASYTLNNNNAVVNALDTDQELTEQFAYTINDGQGGTDQAIITVKIKGVNDAPSATNDVATMTTNHASVSSNVLPNDIDPEGKTLSVSAIRTGTEDGTGNAGTVGSALAGSYGSLLLKADGSYTYSLDNSKTAVLALNDGQSLTDTFTYTNSDDKGNTDKAQLTITINGVNDAPQATNDTASISENSNSALTGNVSSNDTDPESSALTISAVRTGSESGTGTAGTVGSALAGQYGQLTLNANGSYSYTLNSNNTSVNALRPGDTLHEVFTYTTRDAGNLSDTAQLVITINGENDAPVAVNDTLSGNANTALTIGAVSLLASDGTGPQNDSDIDSSSFSHIVISRLPTASSGALIFDNRAATLSDIISIADLQTGKLRFVPADNFSGSADFAYKVSDGTLLSNEATATLNFAPSTTGDDYSSNIQTTGSIAAGQSRTGNIETARDADWFAINMEAGNLYRINLEGAPTQAGTLSDTYLNGVYNSQGALLANTSNDDFGINTNSQVMFMPASSGTYYISAGAYANYTGSYRLSVNSTTTTPGNDDYRNDITTTGKVTINGNQTGNIEAPFDHDWFRVELSAGKTYRINLDGITLNDSYIRGIHNSKGELLDNTSNDDFGGSRNAQVSFTPSESGSYYIAAAAYSSLTGSYRLSVTEQGSAPADDFSNNINTTGVINAGQNKTGMIEIAQDIDWFRIALQAGHSYRINLEGSSTTGGTLSDPYLKGIFNSSGTALPNTSNDDFGGLNSQVTFTPNSSGNFFIAAGAYGNLTGSYKLSVTELPAANQLLDNSSSLDSLLGSSTAAPSNTHSAMDSSSQHIQALSTTARLLDQAAA